MATVQALVLRAPGTNCDIETCHALELAGAQAQRRHVYALMDSPGLLEQYQLLVIPGGFSYGDDVAAGKILANQLRLRLWDALQRFRDQNRLILGICNGFQVLLKAGLLPGWQDQDGQPATLTNNDSGRFEDRWVHLAVAPGQCPFLADIERLELPVAHAEGKFVCRDEQVMDRLSRSGQIVIRYSTADGEPDPTRQLVPYPASPNGSWGNVAGICDTTGRVLGLMPHPERHVRGTQHPAWTRRPAAADAYGDGLALFRNAVAFLAG